MGKDLQRFTIQAEFGNTAMLVLQRKRYFFYQDVLFNIHSMSFDST